MVLIPLLPRGNASADPNRKEPSNTPTIVGAAVGVVAAFAIVIAILGIWQKKKKPLGRAAPLPVNWRQLPHKHPGHVQRGGYHAMALRHYDEVGRTGRAGSATHKAWAR